VALLRHPKGADGVRTPSVLRKSTTFVLRAWQTWASRQTVAVHDSIMGLGPDTRFGSQA
jgi:hypothetical protein